MLGGAPGASPGGRCAALLRRAAPFFGHLAVARVAGEQHPSREARGIKAHAHHRLRFLCGVRAARISLIDAWPSRGAGAG